MDDIVFKHVRGHGHTARSAKAGPIEVVPIVKAKLS